MKFRFAVVLTSFCTTLAAAGVAFAQHEGHGAQAAAPAPYAGQQTRTIKALSQDETRDLLEGKGMGLAKAAELNGYPGPMHVLEHQHALGLNADQRDRTAQLLAAHKDEVRRLGQQMVDAERALDRAFVTREVDTPTLSTHMQGIGALHAAIRNAHLQTHLRQTELLTPAQVAHYNRLRGYDNTATHQH